ncbi:hypothetical protein J1605_005548 [Eschrichtius robustus]|uniref:Sodium/hydrogen exchanger regulatory region domain-containing protein n=1 Tax=Eschrichtius robustus TaxID=9764 RepID=A0AB34HAV7_ESCRO|nr:hypothetical protein J1605_005548 [Eschrichtius robustus]
MFDIPFFLQTLSYNKYNLKPQTSEKQAKEILIRRQNTFRESTRKGHSLPWGRTAGTKNIRYLSFPYSHPQPAGRDVRAAEFTVDEEFESGEESEEEASAIGSRWSAEHRPGRDLHRSHSPLLQRK